MFRQCCVLLISCVLLGLVAEGQDVNTETYILCRSGKQVRTLRIEQKRSICSMIYTKEGVDSIASRSKDESKCRDTFTQIKSNLVKGSWTCRDISNARVSASN